MMFPPSHRHTLRLPTTIRPARNISHLKLSNANVYRTIYKAKLTLPSCLSRTNSRKRFEYQAVALPLLSLAPTEGPPSPWLALGIFLGLPVALWVYKSMMMFLFQRKIIYMGYAPPGSRTEELGRDVLPPRGLLCDEIRIDTNNGAHLYGIYVRKDEHNVSVRPPKTLMIYFQGNAGNTLMRFPVFERLLSQSVPDLAILAVAPRSYWKSTPRRPTERGLLSDYHHILQYAVERFPDSNIVLYGHSLGGAIAMCLSAQLKARDFPQIKGIILENPFASISGMLKALYPEKWLPYHYLSPFIFDKWDALKAIRFMPEDSVLWKIVGDMLVLVSEKDEVVPNEMGSQMFEMAGEVQGDRGSGQGRKFVVIRGALHEDAWTKRDWSAEMSKYLSSIN